MIFKLAEFTIEGEPVSKSRARFTKRGSKTHAYTPERTKAGEERVAWAFRQRHKKPPTDPETAYRVEAHFYNGTRQRRDIDNMTKLILDGLNGVAWVDDNQVTQVAVEKSYVPKAEARTTVRVFIIGELRPPKDPCLYCGKEYRTYESWRANPNGQKYCSRECANAHRRERRERVCKSCKATFLADRRSRDTTFCSVSCKSAYGRAELECNYCGEHFTKQRSLVRKFNYCSADCLRAIDRQRQAERRTAHFPGICAVCGAGTTRKEYERCNACKRAGMKPSGAPIKSTPGGTP